MRKYIIFGLGEKKSIGMYVIDKLIAEGKVVEYIIDNKSDIKIYNNIPVRKPEVLSKINNPDYFVIVTTLVEREGMMHQLEEYGLKRKIDFEHITNLPDIYNVNECIGYMYGEAMPNTIRIELSSYCNIKCEFCVAHGEKLEQYEKPFCNQNMTFDIVKEIVNQINKIPSIKYINNCEKGEIFCNPQWFEMCQYMAENSNVKNLIFHTNGMLMTKDNVKKLLDLKFEWIQVIFSIDGKSPEENDLYRKNSNFKVIKQNMDYLLENMDSRFDIHIQNAFLATRDEIERYNLGEKLECEYLKKFFKDNVSIFSMPYLATVNKYYEAGNERLSKTYNAHIEKFRIKKSSGFCSLPFTEISIDAFGNINVCGCSRSWISIGNIYTGGEILSLWNDAGVMKNMRRQFVNGENVDMCKGCNADRSKDAYYYAFVKN